MRVDLCKTSLRPLALALLALTGSFGGQGWFV